MINIWYKIYNKINIKTIVISIQYVLLVYTIIIYKKIQQYCIDLQLILYGNIIKNYLKIKGEIKGLVIL